MPIQIPASSLQSNNIRYSQQLEQSSSSKLPIKRTFYVPREDSSYRSNTCRSYLVIYRVWLGYKMVLSVLCAGREEVFPERSSDIQQSWMERGILQSQPSFTARLLLYSLVWMYAHAKEPNEWPIKANKPFFFIQRQ